MSELPPDLLRTDPVRVERLDAGDAEAADAVVCEAFANYPVMRHVLGDAGDDALHLLVRLFTAGRWLRAHPVLGVRAAERGRRHGDRLLQAARALALAGAVYGVLSVVV
jgi:hypothetical protein